MEDSRKSREEDYTKKLGKDPGAGGVYKNTESGKEKHCLPYPAW